MARATASSTTRRPRVNTGKRAAANEVPKKDAEGATPATTTTLGFLPSDPVDHRLTVEGAVLGADGKVNAEAYADLVPRFAGEPAPAEHPYPDTPGLRLGEIKPKGLRLWDDIKSGIESKDGAGWIAAYSSKRFGKKEKWFNIRTCGSWRLAFLLAKLQREVWDRHGLVAGPGSEEVAKDESTEVEVAAPSLKQMVAAARSAVGAVHVIEGSESRRRLRHKAAPRRVVNPAAHERGGDVEEVAKAARFDPKPAPSLKEMVATARASAFPGVFGEVGAVRDIEATPKRKGPPSGREAMPSAKKKARSSKSLEKKLVTTQPAKASVRPRGAPPPPILKVQIFDNPLPQGIEDVLLKQQQEATRARKEQLLARLQAKFQKNNVEDVLSKEWDMMAQEQNSLVTGLIPTSVASGDSIRRRLRKKTAPGFA